MAPGALEPIDGRYSIPRGSRCAHSIGGALAAGGGWPSPIIRQATFATILPGKLPPVNVVTGVPSNPAQPKRRRGRRWTL
jgi:hypothetical protein